MKVEVNGCSDCPMYNAYYAGEEISGVADTGVDCCQHPLAPVDSIGEMLKMPHDNYDVVTPDWCPLKQDSITIELTNK